MSVSAALSLLQILADRKKAYDAINRQLRDLVGDFPVHLYAVDPEIENELVKLLDVILDDDLASYWLWDRPKDGGSITVNGVEWPLRTVEDIRRYVEGRA